MMSQSDHQVNRRGWIRRLALGVAVSIGLSGMLALVGAAPAGAAQELLSMGEKIYAGHSVNSGMFSGDTPALDYYFKLTLETNGDLREYKVLPYQDSSTQIWHTATGNLGTTSSSYVSINSNGNMVLNDENGEWRSATKDLGVTRLVVFPGGDMRLQTNGGDAKWSSRWPLGACDQGVPITNGKVSTILSSACRLIGTHYCLGAGNWDGPTAGCGFASAIDCSGLTMHAISRGVYLAPRQSYALIAHYTVTQFNSDVGDWGGDKKTDTTSPQAYLEPGDLVFFRGAGPASPGHVGIYLGAGKLIDAFDTGVPVAVHNFSTSYSSGYLGSVRYW